MQLRRKPTARQLERQQLRRSRIITLFMAAIAVITAAWKAAAVAKSSPRAHAAVDAAKQKTLSFARDRRSTAVAAAS